MLTQTDLNQISQRGISEEKVMGQLHQFEKGFPFLKLEAAASIEKGILALDEVERQHAIESGLSCGQFCHRSPWYQFLEPLA